MKEFKVFQAVFYYLKKEKGPEILCFRVTVSIKFSSILWENLAIIQLLGYKLWDKIDVFICF